MKISDYYPIVDELLRWKANERLFIQTLKVTLSLNASGVKRVLVDYIVDQQPVGDDLEVIKAVIRKTQNWRRF